MTSQAIRHDVTRLGDQDLFLFNEGAHLRLYDKLGSHLITEEGVPGVYFAVWAPNAHYVSVIGDFNDWDRGGHPLARRAESGIWEGFIPGMEAGTRYKYYIESQHNGYHVEKADPYAFQQEPAPGTSSIVCDLAYDWGDQDWMDKRHQINRLDAPISIYEMHPGSWRRKPEEDNRPLTYRELAEQLPDYLVEMGYTHVEFLPVMEHPFYASWGYQVTGFYSPTSRYGSPGDFMALVDALHRRGIGVILDWVPSHFPTDQHGLGYFDGTHLYEHADPRQGFHPDWNTFTFNFGRHEVRSFLLSNALFWLERYHIDGLRVDAVASTLYLDYSRKAGEWVPNEYGGNEDLEAISFLRRMNEEVYRAFPDVQTIAEESTAWPMVSRPLYLGGLGFGMKWDMGWMHDTLAYMARDPIHRHFHHNELTFRGVYAFSENFVLPLSHDEVVHGKGSLLNKMPGDDWQKFANLRLLLGWMYGQPGKKLTFMGAELGQWREWAHDESLDWHLLDQAPHAGIHRWLQDLNRAYAQHPALYELDCHPDGFRWIDCSDAVNSVFIALRRGRSDDAQMIVAANFTPVPHFDYRIGVPTGGLWREVLNSDSSLYGGSNIGNLGGVEAEAQLWHGQPYSLALNLPPLAVLFLSRA
jgi:1,4-alpha-glucan branching enzyme